MAQRVTFRIIDQPDGRFDLVVSLGGRSHYTLQGFLTLAEAEEEAAFVRTLMTACKAPTTRCRSSH